MCEWRASAIQSPGYQLHPNKKQYTERDSIKQLAQDVVTRKSINFTNVKVDKSSKSGKPKIYDPTNFSLTYSYNETLKRNINVAENLDKNYRGLFSYNFNGQAEMVEPFKNSKILKGSALRLIRDFNFYPLPSQFAFRTDMYRHYNEVQLRNISNPNMIIPMTFNKDFIWNRYVDLRYNLTRSLEVDFSSQATARIDELEGRVNRNDDDYQAKKDTILKNLFAMGRPTLYHHLINATYMVPINKLPMLDWTSLQASYQGMYDWQAGPITDKSVKLGNVIENTRQMQINGTLSMVTLYNKVGFLKEINQKLGTSSRQQQRNQRARPAQQPGQRQTQGQQPDNAPAAPKIKQVQYTTDNIRLKANTPKSIFHKLRTENIEVEATDKKGAKVDGKVDIVNENRITFTPSENVNDVKFIVKGKIEVKGDLGKKFIEYGTRALMSVRSINIGYTSTDGTVLPGFMPEPHFFGSGKYTPNKDMFGDNSAQTTAPGLPFLLGWQNKDFARHAAEKGWITRDTSLNSPFVMSHSESFNFRANVEPIPDLKIDVTANRTYSERSTEFYNYDGSEFINQNKSVNGNFTMSVNTMKTAFSKMSTTKTPRASKAFENLKSYRETIATRLANQRAGSVPGYDPTGTDGYGTTSQQVLIPAFIAAYTGQSPDKVSLDPFPSMKFMRPNWRITYDGAVSQSALLKRYFKSLNFNHTYRSSYNVGSFTSNLDFDENLYVDGFSYARDKLENFIAQRDINSVSISEQFSPLIGLDITWINDLETRAEIKTTRNLALSFANNQLTEMLSKEMVFGLGYRFSRMDLIIKTKKSQKAYSNDLNVRADLSFRKTNTILRKLVEADEQMTAGQSNVTLKTSADYMLSDRFQLRLYYDRILNKPLIGSFNTANTNFGVSFRFTLAQ